MTPATIPVPDLSAIAAHRAAYDAFQVAPDNGALDAEDNPAMAAQEAYDAASLALVAVPCPTRADALALLRHLRWWIADEAEFAADHQPAYGIAVARAADLARWLEGC